MSGIVRYRPGASVSVDDLFLAITRSDGRRRLREPWVRGGYEYASDGAALVRRATTKPDSIESGFGPKLVDVDPISRSIDLAIPDVDLGPTLGLERLSPLCMECDESRVNCTCAPDGLGYDGEPDRPTVMIGGVPFNPDYLDIFRLAGAARCALAPVAGVTGLIVEAVGWRGVVLRVLRQGLCWPQENVRHLLRALVEEDATP